MGRTPAAGAEAELAGPDWNFACPDWEQRLREGRSLVPDLPLNEALASKAVGIFNNLRLPDVPGYPRLAEAAGDWQRDIVGAAFGSWFPDAPRPDGKRGVRAIRSIMAMVPKKNSKTTAGAAITLTAALLNERPKAKLQLIGPTQPIANIAFDQIAGMIEADPEGYLKKRFLIRHHNKTIFDILNRSEIEIKTFDMKVATGSKPIFVLADELHLLSDYSYATRVFGQIEGNMLANPEALLVAITTQADVVPFGLFKQKLQYARGVRDGRITNRVRTLPLLYEFPEKLQAEQPKPGRPRRWEDPKLWPMVLPNLGLSISIERLIDEFEKAKEEGEEETRRWASQHLNIEIGLGMHAERWRGADHLQAASLKDVTFETLKERCEVVVFGIDGGGLDDLYAICAMGRDRETGAWLSVVRAWAQETVLVRRKDIAERLRDFAKDGDLVICKTASQDLEEAAEIIGQFADEGLLPEKASIGVDPYDIAATISQLVLPRERGGAGLTREHLISISQGWRLTGAIHGAERKLSDKSWRPAAQPLMSWCVGNAKAEQKGNAVLITKETAGKAKIDPLIAALCAFSLMSRIPEAAEGDLITGADILMMV